MVTSSAVVGSSASSRLGRARERDRDHRPAGACRRRTGADSRRGAPRRPGCRPGPAARRARSVRARRPRPVCAFRFSPICRPTVSTGLSAVIGSWKIMRDLAARARRRSSRSGRPTSSRPRQITEPSTRPGARTRPRIERSATLLPEPDSPTSPSTSPGCTSRSMPSTAVSVPRARGEAASCRPRTSSGCRRDHRRGRSRSARPSPSRLKPSPVTTMAMPGKTEIHQAVLMKFLPSAIRTPHSAAGGWAPRPR